MSETTSEETSETRSWRERIASTSPGLLIGMLVLALAVAGIAGFGIGFKVEQHRAKSNAKSAVAKNKNKQKAPPKGVAAAAPWIGTVTSARGANLALKVGTTNRVARLSYGTKVSAATKGAAGDLKVGSRVLFKAEHGATKAILVLPTGSIGIKLTAVTPTSITYTGLGNKPVTVNTTGAAIYKAVPAHPTDLKKSTPVMVRARRAGKNKRYFASQIVVLPSGVQFA